ncbi:hypothetical protein PR048_004062 [Dryococelus australis]|uniref:Uncharacterized protein n=1 Tax=Dryococelus australis TaxID=614101 RepID=A0ABQ9I5K5_9NEOP|nr:hypothetical protein PR048_004062 [Dryococelus australis]
MFSHHGWGGGNPVFRLVLRDPVTNDSQRNLLTTFKNTVSGAYLPRTGRTSASAERAEAVRQSVVREGLFGHRVYLRAGDDRRDQSLAPVRNLILRKPNFVICNRCGELGGNPDYADHPRISNNERDRQELCSASCKDKRRVTQRRLLPASHDEGAYARCVGTDQRAWGGGVEGGFALHLTSGTPIHCGGREERAHPRLVHVVSWFQLDVGPATSCCVNDFSTYFCLASLVSRHLRNNLNYPTAAIGVRLPLDTCRELGTLLHPSEDFWSDYSPLTKVNRVRFPAGNMTDDASGQRVSSVISRFPRPCITLLLLTHLVSPSSALKIYLLRAVQISPLHSLTLRFISLGPGSRLHQVSACSERIGVERYERPLTSSCLGYSFLLTLYRPAWDILSFSLYIVLPGIFFPSHFISSCLGYSFLLTLYRLAWDILSFSLYIVLPGIFFPSHFISSCLGYSFLLTLYRPAWDILSFSLYIVLPGIFFPSHFISSCLGYSFLLTLYRPAWDILSFSLYIVLPGIFFPSHFLSTKSPSLEILKIDMVRQEDEHPAPSSVWEFHLDGDTSRVAATDTSLSGIDSQLFFLSIDQLPLYLSSFGEYLGSTAITSGAALSLSEHSSSMYVRFYVETPTFGDTTSMKLRALCVQSAELRIFIEETAAFHTVFILWHGVERDPLEGSLTSGIVRHDSHVRKSGNRTRFAMVGGECPSR